MGGVRGRLYPFCAPGSFRPKVCKNVRLGFLYWRQETVFTIRKLIKVTTFQEQLKRLSCLLKPFEWGKKDGFFTPLTLSSSLRCR